jgi:hypothetical protein
MGNQRGSMILAVTILVSVVALILTFTLLYFKSQIAMQAHDRSGEDGVRFRNKIEMLLGRSHVCQNSLNSSFIGGSLAELSAKSSAGTLRLADELGRSLIEQGTAYEGLRVRKLAFSAPVRVRPADPLALRADLTVGIEDTEHLTLKPVIIPFYLVVDTAGIIQGCMASSYLEIDHVERTLEDVLCRQLRGDTHVFTPKEQVCVPI